MYDVVVLGGGPGGYKTAELCAQNGCRVALVEENALGGICLNQGCIPFKSYLHISRLRDNLVRAGKAKLVNCSDISIDQAEVLKYKNDIVFGLNRSVELTLKRYNVEIFHGTGNVVENYGDRIIIDVNGEKIEGTNLVIATGSEEKNLSIPSRLSYKIVYSKGMLELDALPKNVDIIGAGAIGLEAASYFADAGCNVTVIEALDHVGGNIDIEISKALESILLRKGIQINTETLFKNFDEDGVVYTKDGQDFVRNPDCVLVAVGRKPRLDKITLNTLGILYDKTGIKIDTSCRTNIHNIYACGDVTGMLMLAHTAYRHAKVIADTIAGKHSEIDYSIVPRVIYSNPEQVSVGMREEDCIKSGMKYEAIAIPMTYSGKYFAENGKDGAKAKMIVDGQKRIIGFHMIGNGASEISATIELMIANQMTIDQIQDMVFAHPTYGEIIGELAGLFC